MAALLWLLLLSADGLIAAALCRVVAGPLHLSAWACGMWVLAVFLLAPWTLTSVSVLLRARAGDSLVWSSLARAALTEWASSTLAVMRMIVEPWRRSPDSAGADNKQSRPVLLLHGVVCNRGIWRGWLRELRAAGFTPVRALNLEPLLADIPTQAAHVARELVALQRASRGARIDVIAHSMGGLIARAALPLVGPQTIRRIVTLASPHHGTRVARHYRGAPVRQMRPDSPWLATLNAAQEEHWSVPVTSIYSLEDNLVVPADSARLAGADCHPLRGVGHFGLLGSRAARRCALAALSPG